MHLYRHPLNYARDYVKEQPTQARYARNGIETGIPRKAVSVRRRTDLWEILWRALVLLLETGRSPTWDHD